jgi:hypothetical protein
VNAASMLDQLGRSAAIWLGCSVVVAAILPVCTLRKRGLGMGYVRRALAMGLVASQAFIALIPVTVLMGPLAGSGWTGTVLLCLAWLASQAVVTVIWTFGLGNWSVTRGLLEDGTMLIGNSESKGLGRVGS